MLFFIMETKNKVTKVHGVQRKLNFQNSYIVDLEGIAGGLVAMLTGYVDVIVYSTGKNFINLQLIENGEQNAMRVAFVHAPNDYKEKPSIVE